MNIQLSLKKLELTNLNHKNKQIINIINSRKQNTYYSKIIMDNQLDFNDFNSFNSFNKTKLYQNNNNNNKKWYMHFL
jgi:hypothetical protein